MVIQKMGLIIGCCLAAITLASAQNPELFEKGKDNYKDGNYQQAIDDWSAILSSGEHSAALYFNLGNAHYKLNNIGPSIYYYEKALQLDPNDKDVRNNIAFAENARVDIIEPLPKTVFVRWYERISGIMNYNGWAIAGVFCASMTVLLFLLYYFSVSERRKRILFVASLAAGMLMLTFTVMAFLVYSDDLNDRPAIVYSESVEVRNEPRIGSETAYIIHEGTKLQILDEDDEWVRIQLADGKDGWILAESIKAL